MPPLLVSHHQPARGAKRGPRGHRRTLAYALLVASLVAAALLTSSTLCAMLHMMLSYR